MFSLLMDNHKGQKVLFLFISLLGVLSAVEAHALLCMAVVSPLPEHGVAFRAFYECADASY